LSAHWLSYAEAQHENLSLDLDRLLGDYDLVRSALGTEWLGRQTTKEGKDRPLAHFHPLYRELRSSTNQALVTVAELSKYLQSFAADPALPGVITDLRSDKYPSTLFELAMAHRWRLAGADVHLQPPTPSGVADFEATISGAPFVVECSVTPDMVFQEPSFVLPSLVTDAVAAVLGQKLFALAVKVTVFKPLAGDWQGELRQLVKEIAAAVIDRIHQKLDTHLTKETDAWRVEMEQVTDATEGFPSAGWDISFRKVMRPKTEGVAAYKLLQETEGIERVRVFLKLPRESANPDDFIAKKLKREARQLRGIPGPRVVLLDITGVTQDILQDPHEALQQRLLYEMRSTPELVCVFVMSRGFSTALRFQYRALFVPNLESIYQLPESFLGRLAKLEWTRDFLTDRELPVLDKDEAMRDWQRRSRPPR
jgi:hypothetical protein